MYLFDCAGLVLCGFYCCARLDWQLKEEDVVELGTVLKNPCFQRRRRAEAKEGLEDSAISICDLTGVAVQDIAIAEVVYQQAASAKKNSLEMQAGEPKNKGEPLKKRTKTSS